MYVYTHIHIHLRKSDGKEDHLKIDVKTQWFSYIKFDLDYIFKRLTFPVGGSLFGWKHSILELTMVKTYMCPKEKLFLRYLSKLLFGEIFEIESFLKVHWTFTKIILTASLQFYHEIIQSIKKILEQNLEVWRRMCIV